MTVKQLIEELEQYDPYQQVMSSSNYGDYHNTEQLDPIQSIQLVEPVESAYSNSRLAVPTELDLEDRLDEEQEEILVLRYTR